MDERNDSRDDREPRTQALQRHFLALIALTGPERDAYHQAVLIDDPDLARELDLLVTHHEGTPDSSPPRPATEADARDTLHWIDRMVGDVLIRSVIGVGGMGAVYKGTQTAPNRTVAVKILRDPIPSDESLLRFEYESLLLSRMNHPGIGKVFSADVIEERGFRIPFFVMEYFADACTIEEYAERSNLSVRQRLELFLEVCSAVGHAHQKGVIHRDLKPQNILIDSSGVAQVIDFGVARSTEPIEGRSPSRTRQGQMFGTPRYMAPEQFLDETEIDPRADVYTLGVILYQLLVGKPPYPPHANPAQAHAAARDANPERPSVADRRLDGDLDAIILTAMEKSPSRRYRDATAFEEDIRRFLDGNPVQARTPTLAYTIRKMVARNRRLSSIGAAAVGLLVTAIIVSTVFYRDSLTAARSARLLQERITEIGVLLEPSFGVSEFDEAAEKSRQLYPDDPLVGLAIEVRIGEFKNMRFLSELLDRLEVAELAAYRVGQTSESGADREQALAWSRGILREVVYGPAIDHIDDMAEESPVNAVRTAMVYFKYAWHAELHDITFRLARNMSEHAERIQPRDPVMIHSGHERLATALSTAGRYEEALEEYHIAEEILEQSARNELFQTKLWYLINNRAETEEMLGHHAEAEAGYRKALDLGGTLPGRGDMVDWASMNLGRVLNRQKRHAEALESLMDCWVSLDYLGDDYVFKPHDEWNYVHGLELAEALLATGRDPEALRVLTRLCIHRNTQNTAAAMPELDDCCERAETLSRTLAP